MGPSDPEMVLFFVRPSDVQIIDTWYVTDGRWETAGRVLMGLDPGSPLL